MKKIFYYYFPYLISPVINKRSSIVLKPGIMILAILTSIYSHSQTENRLTYELINEKIASDSLLNFGFKFLRKSFPISEEEVLSLSDSSHYTLTYVVDSNATKLYEFRSWYGDSLRTLPISLNKNELTQLNNSDKYTKWELKQITPELRFTRSIKKRKGKKFFAISRPIFFNDQKAAILVFYLVNENTERCFLQIYQKDDSSKWEKYYDYLLWI